LYNPFFPATRKETEEVEEKKRKCPFCGHINLYGELTCSKCFAYVYPEEEEAASLVKPEDIRPYSTFAVTSMVLGITGILVCICYPLGILNSIGAIIVGYMGRKRLAEDDSQRGDKLALWGIISGITGFTGSLIFAIIDAIWKISSIYY